MPMDKSWIHLKNRLSDEYWDGLCTFIEVGKNYANSLGGISCPCMKCRNHEMFPPETVKAHIHRWGFDTSYTTWIHHGEVRAAAIINEPVDDKKSTTRTQQPMSVIDNKGDMHRRGDTWINPQAEQTFHQMEEEREMKIQTQSAIDNWGDMHHRGASWVNPQAEQAFNTLEEERQTQRTQSISSSTRPAFNEHGVLEQVLDMRRGHNIGVGPTLSQKYYSGASSSSAGSYSDATSSAQPDPRVRRYLEKSYQQQVKIYENQVKMLELMAKLQPNIQLPTIDRPKPVDLDAPLTSSDDDGLDDDSDVGDAAT